MTVTWHGHVTTDPRRRGDVDKDFVTARDEAETSGFLRWCRYGRGSQLELRLRVLMRPSRPVRHFMVRRNASRCASSRRAGRASPAWDDEVAYAQLVQRTVDVFLAVAEVGADSARLSAGAGDDPLDRGRQLRGIGRVAPVPQTPPREIGRAVAHNDVITVPPRHHKNQTTRPAPELITVSADRYPKCSTSNASQQATKSAPTYYRGRRPDFRSGAVGKPQAAR
jgi:hypothetical protein